jgi:hypothetical protein
MYVHYTRIKYVFYPDKLAYCAEYLAQVCGAPLFPLPSANALF